MCVRLLFLFSESERAERERKGDLDQYERLDGDRNRTSQSLAVKKVACSTLFCFQAALLLPLGKEKDEEAIIVFILLEELH